MNKMAEMFDLTEREILIATPRIREIRSELKKNIDNALIRRCNKNHFYTPFKGIINIFL